MSFEEHHARFRRLHKEHAAWQLLRSDNAPLVLAFVVDVYEEDNEVPFGRAKVALDSELAAWRAQGVLEHEVNAATYLRQWIQSGWLRELDDQLSQTDACEVALRFCQQLDQRETNATASHLRIVQDAVRDLSMALNPDPAERIALLEAQQVAIQQELDGLQAGIVRQLSAVEQRERLIEMYQLAAVLTGDFRRVEDEIRRIDQQLRVDMIESGGSRGQIILKLLAQEKWLADSDAGRAFDGFFQLLCDQNRSTELREQLKSILNRPAARYLNAQQRRYLGKLMRALSRESERVFQVRRRTEEGLRQYIDSGAASEKRAVDRLLQRLEKLAVGFKEADLSLRHDTGLRLHTGSINPRSPDSLALKMPEQAFSTCDVQPHENNGSPSDEMLQHLHAVQMRQVAQRIQHSLRDSPLPLSIATLIKQLPIHAGLEELVAFLRVARAVGAAELPGRETVMIKDRNGQAFKVEIPHYVLSGEQFPASLDQLVL